ncbi:hypothetical protein EK21DRAFT_114628 [Setomelanomma holmii]|uniref:Uncharacterized protein n=1 Tax=Setomelanomma holmii TaxID=210430 RepID=A0A9P4LJK0_9PLEO|nr:hypothetical protein EK21DRAFT_114628 [Setomelanomma holmii]
MTSPDYDRYIGTYPKATLKTLPQEKCDMIYELREAGERLFANTNVVGKDFAREAYKWLYEYGDLGRLICLETLPAIYREIFIERPHPEELPFLPKTVGRHLRALADLDHVKGLKLKISIFYIFAKLINFDLLEDLAVHMRRVVDRLDSKQAIVNIELHLRTGDLSPFTRAFCIHGPGLKQQDEEPFAFAETNMVSLLGAGTAERRTSLASPWVGPDRIM